MQYLNLCHIFPCAFTRSSSFFLNLPFFFPVTHTKHSCKGKFSGLPSRSATLFCRAFLHCRRADKTLLALLSLGASFMPCRQMCRHSPIHAILSGDNLDIIFTNSTCNPPFITSPKTWWNARTEREKRGTERREFRNQFYLQKPAMDVCVFIFSDTGSQLSEANQHFTNFNI